MSAHSSRLSLRTVTLMSEGYTEFLFVFNDRWRAEAGAEAARQLGYQVQIRPGDGEGRHFQLQLRLARPINGDDLDVLVEETLRPLLGQHRGRYEGSMTSRFE
jgi:hypothetical protein